MEYILLILLGIVAGTMGSLVGLGGGIITVPALLFFQRMGWLSQPLEHQNIVAISLMAIIFTAFASTLTNHKYGRIDFKSGLIFFLGAGPAVAIGAWAGMYVPEGVFYILFGMLMLFTTYLLSVRDRIKPLDVNSDISRVFTCQGVTHRYSFNRYIAIAISALAGFIAGIFGVGGGSFYVPMMVILFKFPVYVATATSMFMILLATIVGSISHVMLGNVVLLYVLFVGLGAYLGGVIGPTLASRLSGRTILVILRLIIVVVAIQMILKGI